MNVPSWLRWFGSNVVLPLIRDEVHLVVQKELQRHGVGVPVSPDSPGVLLREEPRK
jgi:hypothetical protein